MDNPEFSKTIPPYVGWVARSRKLLEPLVSMCRITSALDLGCGSGTWLGALNDLGVSDVFGVDARQISSNILFDRELSKVQDLGQPLDLGRKFDLVICLEVAEHIDGGDSGAAELMRTISRHSDLVLFSAATPGQPGDHHVNCQPHEYWHKRFADLGYKKWDIIRPYIASWPDMEWWYKRNTFIYSRRTT
jgi:SAM-dependent methyltransferase